MTTIREAAQLALVALDTCRIVAVSDTARGATPKKITEVTPKNITAAIDALRAALDQPEPEPVAWHYTNTAGRSVMHWQPSPSLDEDFAMARRYPHAHKVTPLYAAPPQRKPLSQEQLHSIREHQRLLEQLGPVWAPMLYYFCKAIEDAHGIGDEK